MPVQYVQQGEVVISPPVLPREKSAVERRVAVSEWLSASFTGQAPDPMPVVVELSPDYEPEVGELLAVVRGVQNELLTRNRGRIVLVFVTQDDTVREVLRAIAIANDVPIWVAPSRGQIELAEPAISLTPAKRSALDNLAFLGTATASAVAERSGGNPVSVGNVLSGLFSDGLLLRHEGGGRKGHAYVHPAMLEASTVTEPLTTTVELSDALSAQIADVAERMGRAPTDLVTEAWREFLATHGDQISERYQEISRARRGDRETLLAALTQDSESRARATRPRRKVLAQGETSSPKP